MSVFHELMNIKGHSFRGIPHKLQSLVRTNGRTNTATHAPGRSQGQFFANMFERFELAVLDAQTALLTPVLMDHTGIAGRCEHGHAVAPGLHCPAATGATIANRIETAEHGVLEKRVVNMPALLLCFKNLHSFLLGNTSRPFGVMFGNESDKRLSHNQADVQRQTRLVSRCSARTLQGRDVVRILKHDVPGRGIRNDLLQVAQLKVAINCDQLSGVSQRNDLAVISVGKGDFSGTLPSLMVSTWSPLECPEESLEPPRQGMAARPDGYVEVRPAGINIRMQAVFQAEIRFGPGLCKKGPGGGFYKKVSQNIFHLFKK